MKPGKCFAEQTDVYAPGKPNINTFLEIQIHEKGSTKFIPHTLKFDGLSEVYESSVVDYIEKPELGFFHKIYRLLIKSYNYIFT